MKIPRLPQPPSALLDSLKPLFAPAPELQRWAFDSFVQEGARLKNPDHEHLKDAEILFLWSSIPFRKGGRDVVGTAQRGLQQGSLGKKELIEQRYREWYRGELPDFVITICAPYWRDAAPVSCCALIEHEMYHCAQERDEFGQPRFTEDNWPKWTIRGHDVEEFVGVAARYGAHSVELLALKTVMERGPLIGQADVNAVCGCGLRVA